MEKELIKNTLIERVRSAKLKFKPRMPNEPLKELINRLESTKPFAEEITRILNEIIAEQKLDLTEDQKTELIEYLNPTIIQMIQDQMQGE